MARRIEEGLDWDLSIEGVEDSLTKLDEVERKVHSTLSLSEKEVKTHKKSLETQKEENKALVKESGLKDEINESTGDIQESTEKTGEGMADFGKKIKGAAFQIAGLVGVGLSLMWLVSQMVEQFDNIRQQMASATLFAAQLTGGISDSALSASLLLDTVAVLGKEIEQVVRETETRGLFPDIGQTLAFIEGIVGAIGMVGERGVRSMSGLGEAIIDVRRITGFFGIDATTALSQITSLVNDFKLGIQGVTGAGKGAIKWVKDFYYEAVNAIRGTDVSFKDFINTIIQSGPQLMIFGFSAKRIITDVGFLIRAMPNLPESMALSQATKMMQGFRQTSLEAKIYFGSFLKTVAGATMGPFEIAAEWDVAGMPDQLRAIEEGIEKLGFANLELATGTDVQKALLMEQLDVLNKSLGIFGGLEDIATFIEILASTDKDLKALTDKELDQLVEQTRVTQAWNTWGAKILQYQKPMIQILKDYLGGLIRTGVKWIIGIYHLIKTFFQDPWGAIIGKTDWGTVWAESRDVFKVLAKDFAAEAAPPGIPKALWEDLVTGVEEIPRTIEEFEALEIDVPKEQLENLTKQIQLAREAYQEMISAPMAPTGEVTLPPFARPKTVPEKITTGVAKVGALGPTMLYELFGIGGDFGKELIKAIGKSIALGPVLTAELLFGDVELPGTPDWGAGWEKFTRIIGGWTGWLLDFTLPFVDWELSWIGFRQRLSDFANLLKGLFSPREKKEIEDNKQSWFDELFKWGKPALAMPKEEREAGALAQVSQELGTNLEEWSKLTSKQKAAWGRLDEILDKIENTWDVRLPRDLIYAMSLHETAGWTEFKGTKGERGLMHVRDVALADIQKEIKEAFGVGWTFEQMIKDPFKQLVAGTFYLVHQMLLVGGDLEGGIKAYNLGMANYNRALEGSTKLTETGTDYYDKVMKERMRIGELAPGLKMPGALPTTPPKSAQVTINVKQDVNVEIAKVENLEVAMRKIQREVTDMKNYLDRIPVGAYR